MAAIVIRGNAKVTWLTGLAGVRAKASEMAQRTMNYAAAAVMMGAAGAALLQLAAQITSFPAPIAVTALTLGAVALCRWARRVRMRPRRAR